MKDPYKQMEDPYCRRMDSQWNHSTSFHPMRTMTNHDYPYKCIYAKELSDIAEIKRLFCSRNLDDFVVCLAYHNNINGNGNANRNSNDSRNCENQNDVKCHLAFQLFHIPRKLSNLCHEKRKQLPSWAVSDEYFTRLLQNLFHVILSSWNDDDDCSSRIGSGSSRNNAVAAEILLLELCVKLIQVMHSLDVVSKVLNTVYRNYWRNGRDDSATTSFIVDFMKELATRVGNKYMSQLVKHCILYCLTAKDFHDNLIEEVGSKERECYQFLHYLFHPLVSYNKTFREEITLCTILSSRGSLSPSDGKLMVLIIISLYIANEIGGYSNNDKCILLDELDRVVQYWSEKSFIQNSTVEVHRYSTEFIVKSLQWIIFKENDKINNSSNEKEVSLIPHLVKGVSSRLDVTDPTVRRDGLRVAEIFAPMVGQANVKFDELNGHREDDDVSLDCKGTFLCFRNDLVMPEQITVSDSEVAAKDSLTSTVHYKRKNRRRFRPLGDVNPDEEYESYSDDYDDSDSRDLDFDEDSLEGSDSDDSFNEDDLKSLVDEHNDDLEDLREIPKPLYLRECLKLLQCGENEENADTKIETALQSLQQLVESSPPDLSDVCVPIIKQLVYIENKFNLPNFNELRINSMIAIVVREPIASVEYLSVVLFDSGTIRTRTEILDVLSNAAEILCGSTELEKRKELLSKCSLLTEDLSTRVSGKRRLVNTGNADHDITASNHYELSDTKTRRWGYRRDGGMKAIKNRFAPHAHVFFFLLLSGCAKSKDDKSVWDDTGHVLSRFLYSLSVFVESSGNSPSTSYLAVELFSFVWSCHMSERENVRQAVLYTLAICVGFLPQEYLYRFTHDNPSFVNYLTRCISSDPDKGCRELASVVTSNIQKALYLLESV